MFDNLINNIEHIYVNIAGMFRYDSAAPMLFSSGLFWILFLIFIPFYAMLKKSRMRMIVFVVLFSLYFYYKSSGFFFLMLIGTSLVDWLISKAIFRVGSRSGKKCLMWFSIIDRKSVV